MTVEEKTEPNPVIQAAIAKGIAGISIEAKGVINRGIVNKTEAVTQQQLAETCQDEDPKEQIKQGLNDTRRRCNRITTSRPNEDDSEGLYEVLPGTICSIVLISIPLDDIG